MPPPTYLISRVADPIFALFIGLSAAATRINREEKELGHTTQQTVDAGLRYVTYSHMKNEFWMGRWAALVWRIGASANEWYRRLGLSRRGDEISRK